MSEKFIQKIKTEIIIIIIVIFLLLGYLFILPIIRDREEAYQEEQLPVQEEEQEIIDDVNLDVE